MNPRIFYTKPSITKIETDYASDAAKNGWGDNCYKYIIRFEELFKNYLGVKYAISTSSCTGALHMGLSALGIGPGDEVILADANWIASAAPIAYLGATPVFVDILSDTWCLDPSSVREAITTKTKAIIAVHLYGNLCELNELLEIGAEFGIPVIEDSAEAIGSTYHNKRAGSIGKFGVFSFHGTKTITTGEGGMFVTNDDDIYEHVLTLSNHGRAKGCSKQFWPDIVGFKYKLSNIQAAIGCGQMERINDLTARKKEIFNFYFENLGDLSDLEMNPEKEGTHIGAWMPTVVFSQKSSITRKRILEAFSKDNIDARVFFYPLSSLPMYKPKRDNIVSWDIPERAINLPSYHDITEKELHRVCNVVKNLLLGR